MMKISWNNLRKMETGCIALFVMLFMWNPGFVFSEQGWITVSGAPELSEYSNIISDRNGDIWLSVFDRGVYKYDGESWTEYTASNGLPTMKVSDIAVSPGGSIVALTELGVCRYDDGQWETIRYPFEFIENNFSQISMIEVDGTGTIWCSLRSFLLSYKDNKWTIHGSSNGYIDTACQPLSIAAGSDGSVYISSLICDDSVESPYCTYSYSNDVWSKTDTSNLQSSAPIITTMTVNARNEAWASDGSKLYQLIGNVWEYRYRGASLGHKALYFDANNTIWASSYTGVSWLNNGEWRTFTKTDGLPGNTILSIAEDKTGMIWAMAEQGLARFDPNNVSVEEEGPGIVSLRNCYPNPANPSTVIEFSLTDTAPVAITVHNALGQKVRDLSNGISVAGEHKIVWDGLDDEGAIVATGVYFVELRTSERAAAKKITVVR